MKPLPVNTEPLNVVMRVRPMNNREYKDGAKTIVRPADDKLIVLMDPHEDTDDILRANRSREKQYIFDHIFSMEATQEEVYYAAVEKRNIIENVLSGYNCTVFAYGATGAGKTYTMLGSDNEPGIMVHTLNNLFKKMEETKDEVEYLVSMAYLEIYNECVRDLLCPDSGTLELREDAGGSITVNNLLDISASSTDVILGMLRMGNTNRTSEPTVANKTSSRSHAILKVNVEQRNRVSRVSQEVRCSSLYMVDLAGSERAAVTQNRGKRMIEGAHINRSLLALANCINALGSSNTNYINYRDSKLTRILKEALGGNCKTVMIAHISPASTSYEETRNTLVYAERSKKIKNKARQNVVDVDHHVTQYVHVIEDLNYQIARLKGDLSRAVAGGGGDRAESTDVTSLCEELKILAIEQRDTRYKLCDLERHLLQNALDYQKQSACIQEWEKTRSSVEPAATTAPSSPIFTPNSDLPAVESPTPDLSDTDSSETADHTAGINRPPSQVSSVKKQLNMDSLSLRQAGDVVMSDSQLQQLDDLKTSTVSEDQTTGPEGNVFYVVREESENFSSLRPTRELVMSVSPDSGAEMSVTVPDQREMEPFVVSRAREEIASLKAAKYRLETQHARLEKKLKENKANVAEIKEKLSYIDGFLPMRRDMIDLLQHTSDLEASRVEHRLSSMLMGIHITQHTSLVDQLLHHSASLLEVLETHRSILQEDGWMEMSEDLNQQFRLLSDRQRKLADQVKEVKTIPVLTEMKLPHISRLSAKLYTSMTGSKSDLFINEDEHTHPPRVDISSSSSVHLPGIPLTTTFMDARKSDSLSHLCLPPVHLNHNSVASPTYSKPPCHKSTFSGTLNKSQISEILEAAKKSRDKKIVATLGSEKSNRNKRQAKRVVTKFATVGSVKPSFASNKNKQNTSQSSVVCKGTTTLIDLESTDTATTPTANRSSRLQSKSMMSLQHPVSKSQPHLLLPKGTSNLKHNETLRLKKSMSHISAARNSPSELSESSKLKVKQTRSVTNLSDMDNSQKKSGFTHSTPVLKGGTAQKGVVDKITLFGTMSRPIIRKSVFATQSDVKNNAVKHSPKTRTNSVYNSKAFVDPMHAYRTSQYPQRHRGTLGKRKSKKRDGPLIINQNSHVVRKNVPLRKELTVTKVNANKQFSFGASPYLSPSRSTGAGGSKTATDSRQKSNAAHRL